MMMTQCHRPGDVPLLINGEEKTLRLTLGALAEIEAAFGADGLNELGDRLKNPRAEDVLRILSALIKGGGDPITMAALAASDVDLPSAVKAVAQAFRALGQENDRS